MTKLAANWRAKRVLLLWGQPKRRPLYARRRQAALRGGGPLLYRSELVAAWDRPLIGAGRPPCPRPVPSNAADRPPKTPTSLCTAISATTGSPPPLGQLEQPDSSQNSRLARPSRRLGAGLLTSRSATAGAASNDCTISGFSSALVYLFRLSWSFHCVISASGPIPTNGQ